MRAEQVTDPVAYHGEGPVWSERWGGLRWVDMLAGDVLSLGAGRAGRAPARRHVAAALRPRRGGGAVIGVERGFALEEPDGTLTTLAELWTDSGVRMNEGGCDPDGRFYCGSMAYDKTPGAAALYRLDPDGSTHVVLEARDDLERARVEPRRLARLLQRHRHPSRSTSSTTTGRAGLIEPAPLRRGRAEDGRPDGLTVDAEGGVWVALNHSGTVRRYTPDGCRWTRSSRYRRAR